jgi:hypothetical protein
LNFLRSSLLISLVSLFVLTGYANEAFCDCHERHPAEQTGHGDSFPPDGGDCQCICHQVFSNVSGAPVQTGSFAGEVQAVVPQADEFPPDAVPPGIDHPPQLA